MLVKEMLDYTKYFLYNIILQPPLSPTPLHYMGQIKPFSFISLMIIVGSEYDII